MAKHPLTGQELEQPDPAPLRNLALWNKDLPCLDHSVAFTGTMPCTGDLQCHICLTRWDPHTCKVIRVMRRGELT